ncbi:MAG: S41 family peptidase [Alcanivoracaceae bacterium]|jgi:carboxyl-terminal processing protease|nr:S41 family peptidase [Alcanivoracaceae bacterium]
MIRFLPAACLGLALLASTALKADPALDAQAQSQGVPITELRVFAEVMERIRGAYIEDIDDRTLLESAIRGMLYELDPHSSYLTPSEFDDLQVTTTGEFGGLGIEVTMENGFVKVVTPIDDTPASRAGLRAGDLILKIDDTFVKGLALEDAIKLLRGEVGSEVVLSILSQGTEKPRTVTLKRDRIRIQSVRSQMLEPGFGYLRITQFQSHSGRDSEKALRKLVEDGNLKGLVLDLRNNPGGVLSAAVQISDLFLNDGLIVYTQGRDETTRVNYAATDGDLLNGLPMIVLVNGGSASASEIVAGALQDHGRAIVIGQRSFGKGSVQTILPLHGDRALKLTTARYYTPKGRSIQAEGIVPDIATEISKVELIEGLQGVREADLRGHLENGQHEEKAGEKSQPQPLAVSDFTLYQALSVLKGIALASPRSSD